MKANEILDLPMDDNDAGADTIRGYLVRLLADLWEYGEEFDSKRPFGFSDWRNELYRTLADAGLIAAERDADDILHAIDTETGQRLIASAVAALGNSQNTVDAPAV